MCFGLALSGGAAHAGLNDGLVAYYPFSGSGADSSGGGNDATTVAATLGADRSGHPNQAYAFDGTTSFIEVSPAPKLNVLSQDWSISAWIKTGGASQLQFVVSRYGCGYECANLAYRAANYDLYVTGTGAAAFSVRDNIGSTFGVESTSIVADSSWHYVTGVLDRGAKSLSMYVDGQLKGATPFNSLGAIDFDPNVPLEMGRLFVQTFPSSGNHFQGSIDEVRVYNRALGQAEISQLMTAVPETSTLTMFLAGAAMLALREQLPAALRRQRRVGATQRPIR